MALLLSLILLILGGTLMWWIEGQQGIVDINVIGTILLTVGCLGLLAALYEGHPPDGLR